MSRTPIAARLDADLVERLRVVAALTGTSQTDILETALTEHLAKIINRRHLADLVEQAKATRRHRKNR